MDKNGDAVIQTSPWLSDRNRHQGDGVERSLEGCNMGDTSLEVSRHSSIILNGISNTNS